MRRRMAFQTCTGISPNSLFASWNLMRIVTSRAFQFPRAFEEAARLLEAVKGADGLEFAFVTRAGRVVEHNGKIRQGLTGNIRKRRAVEALENGGNAAASSFEVALHANFHAPLRTELGGVHDARFAAGLYMLRARTVAALAIDALWKLTDKDGIA